MHSFKFGTDYSVMIVGAFWVQFSADNTDFACVEVLQHSPPSGSCRVRSLYLITLLSGTLSQSSKQLTSIVSIVLTETDN